MTMLPQRNLLFSQSVNFIREEIAKGTWTHWLPSERSLCQSLQVSRNTLRTALVQLKREGVVRSVHGAGNQIVNRRPAQGPRHGSKDVALLMPVALEQLRPTQTLWIDELRAMLSERGCRLHVFHGQQYFRKNAGPALQKLVGRHPHGCWILTLSNQSTQSWFAQAGLPCVVSGSTYPGINLPCRDLDHRATCRHAAGVLLGLGHRHLALVTHRPPRAGDVEGEAGFADGVANSPHPDAKATVLCHDSTPASICSLLRRMREQPNPPTALLVVNPYFYLTVASRLAQLGIRVPQDVSIISRDEDPFLSFLVPSPARYVVRPSLMARTLLRSIVEMLEGRVVTGQEVRIMPEFIRGDSIARPPAKP